MRPRHVGQHYTEDGEMYYHVMFSPPNDDVDFFQRDDGIYVMAVHSGWPQGVRHDHH